METDFNINCTFLTLAYVIGGYDGDEHYDDILEYKDSDSWSKLGTMTKGRSYHGLSVVSINDFPDYD